MSTDDDRRAVAEVMDRFFTAFVSGPECVARLARLPEVFLPGAVIVRTCGGPPTVYDIDGFIAPRRELLSTGELQEFREWETGGRTDVFGDIAQHWCSYAKRWSQDGRQFSGGGTKSVQLVRTTPGWRISAVVWDDDPG